MPLIMFNKLGNHWNVFKLYKEKVLQKVFKYLHLECIINKRLDNKSRRILFIQVYKYKKITQIKFRTIDMLL